MTRRLLLALASSSLAVLALSLSSFAHADSTRISGPFVHDNLAIYLVHGASATGAVPLTLDEALTRRVVKVHETSDVNNLAIENLGNEDVFVQAGDIVKGGKQDRVLTVSLILPPRSGSVSIASFCVEQGRWSARGKEDVRTFSTASSAVPSREAKLAMRAPMPAAPIAGDLTTGRLSPPTRSETSTRQQEVWKKVRVIQDRLTANVGVPVTASASETSLQLALENEKLRDLQGAYLKALEAAGTKDGDVVGYVFAINGKLNSADVYPSNGLFRKMWGKLLRASVTEAIGDKTTGAASAPSIDAVMAFLEAAQRGIASEKTLPANLKLETRNGEQALYFETRSARGEWLHRNYLAK